MAAEAVGGVKEESSEKSNISDINADLTINLNTSDLNESSVSRKPDEIFKLGFGLNDLYKISLEFYRKGECVSSTDRE